MTLLWESNQVFVDQVRMALGDGVRLIDSGPAAARQLLAEQEEVLLVVGPDIDLSAALDVAEQLRLERPEVGVVLLRHRIEVSLLAQALRSGVREVVSADDLSALSEACRRSTELSERLTGINASAATRQGRVVTVFSAKGGVGKTTVSTNIAVELAADHATRVLLVDLDLAFGDVGIALALRPERTMADVVAMAGHFDERGLASVITHHESGVDTVCAPAHPGDAERIAGDTVTELLRVARRVYDFVIVDTPPAFTDHVLSAFDASDRCVLIATLDIPAVKNLRLTLETLSLLGQSQKDEVIVLNRSDAKVGLSAADVAGALQRTIALEIPNSLAVPSAVNRGAAIVRSEPRHAVSQALKTLVRVHIRPLQLMEPEAEPEPAAQDEPKTGRRHAARGGMLRRSRA